MDPRRYSWRDEAGEHELSLVWAPGTDGRPYSLGHGPAQRAVEVGPASLASPRSRSRFVAFLK